METTRTATPAVAREYLRVSHDSSGRARSVTEQHDDNERAGGQHGFALSGEAYSDVSVSASGSPARSAAISPGCWPT